MSTQPKIVKIQKPLGTIIKPDYVLELYKRLQFTGNVVNGSPERKPTGNEYYILRNTANRSLRFNPDEVGKFIEGLIFAREGIPTTGNIQIYQHPEKPELVVIQTGRTTIYFENPVAKQLAEDFAKLVNYKPAKASKNSK